MDSLIGGGTVIIEGLGSNRGLLDELTNVAERDGKAYSIFPPQSGTDVLCFEFPSRPAAEAFDIYAQARMARVECGAPAGLINSNPPSPRRQSLRYRPGARDQDAVTPQGFPRRFIHNDPR
jgi:hypothetical protein